MQRSGVYILCQSVKCSDCYLNEILAFFLAFLVNWVFYGIDENKLTTSGEKVSAWNLSDAAEVAADMPSDDPVNDIYKVQHTRFLICLSLFNSLVLNFTCWENNCTSTFEVNNVLVENLLGALIADQYNQ